MKHVAIILGLFLFAPHTTNLLAHSPADTIPVIHKLDSISIIGTKQNPTRSLMISTSLFERKNQEQMPLQTLESAMRLSPAIDIRERGGKGIQTDISIRGGSFDQTMVMLNGINFTDARTGHQTHALPIDIECIKTIEVMDGVQGVGALAGAINFRTAPLFDNYLRLNFTGGQHSYLYGNLSGAVTKGNLSIFAVASGRKSGGYIKNTDFLNYNAYTRINYTGKTIGFLDFQTGYQWREFGANGFYSLRFPNQFEATRTFISSLRWLKRVSPRITMTASVSYRKNFDRFELIKGDQTRIPFNYHNTDNIGAEVWGAYRWVGGTTSLGGDYTYSHIYSTVLGKLLPTPVKVPWTESIFYKKGTKREIGNFAIKHIYDFRSFRFSGSTGLSVHPYGRSWMWSLSAGWRFYSRFYAEAGAAQSMRLPTFNDLFYTATGYISNPNMLPEQALTYRLGVKYESENWNVSLLSYHRKTNNVIDWVRETSQSDWQASQITKLQTSGVEISSGYSSPTGIIRLLSLSYGYIYSDKESGELISKYSLDHIRNKGVLTLGMNFFKNLNWSIVGSIYDRRGKYIDTAANIKEYKPYFLIDSKISYKYCATEWYLEATNITNTEYFDYGGLIMPGTWINLGVVFLINNF